MDSKKSDKDAVLQVSAGGVLFKKAGNKYMICVITKKNGKIWALPKGRLEEGETPEETVVREVREETGYLSSVVDKIDVIDYYFYWRENNTFYHKIVYYFLLTTDPAQKEPLPRDTEADDVKWLLIGDAHKKLTYLNEKEVIRKVRLTFKILK